MKIALVKVLPILIPMVLAAAADHRARFAYEQFGGTELSEQLRLELAAERVKVDAVYYSRLRHAQRLGKLVQAERASTQQVWTSETEKRVQDVGSEAEIAILLEAIIVRARLACLSSAIYADQGAPAASMALLGDIRNEMKSDYELLKGAFSDLAKFNRPRSARNRIRDITEDESAFEVAKRINEQLSHTMSLTLPDDTQRISLTVPTAALRELQPVGSITQSD